MSEVNSSFASLSQILPLLHTLSAIFLISAQFCAIVAIKIESKNRNFDQIYKIFPKFEILFGVFLAFGVLCGFCMNFSDEVKFIDPMIKAIIVTKSMIAILLLINFCYIHYQLNLVKKSENESEMKDYLIIISNYFLPLNIAFSVILVYLGVVIKGFM